MFTAADVSEKHVVTFVSLPNLRTPGGSVNLLFPQWAPQSHGQDKVCVFLGNEGVALPFQDNKNFSKPSSLLSSLGPGPSPRFPTCLRPPEAHPPPPKPSISLPQVAALSWPCPCAARLLGGREVGGRWPLSLLEAPTSPWSGLLTLEGPQGSLFASLSTTTPWAGVITPISL